MGKNAYHQKSKRNLVSITILSLSIITGLGITGFHGYHNFSKLPHMEKAILLDQAYLRDLAFEEYHKAYLEDPSVVYVHYSAVECLRYRPRFALQFYTKLVERAELLGDDRGQEVFRYCLGQAYSFLGRYDQAIKLIEPHVIEKSDNARFKLLLGRLYTLNLDRKEIQKGERHFRDAILLDKWENPDGPAAYPYAYLGLSRLYLTLGRFDKALAILEENRDRLRDFPETHFCLSAANLANLNLFGFLKHFWLYHLKQNYFWLLSILALNSGLFWLIILYFHDIYEPEPPRLIILVFLLGVLSTIPVMAFQTFYPVLWNVHPELQFPWKLIYSIFFVGFIEEAVKFGVVFLTVYWHREFDEMIDGIIYAGAASLGFSAIENFHYLTYEGPQVYLGRFFAASLGHLCTTGILGYFVSLAKFRRGPFEHPLALGFMIAVLLHGFYDFFCFMGDHWGWLALALSLLEILIFLKLVNLAGKQSVYIREVPSEIRIRRVLSVAIRYEILLCVAGLSIFTLWKFGFQTWMSILYQAIFVLLGSGIFLWSLRKPKTS